MLKMDNCSKNRNINIKIFTVYSALQRTVTANITKDDATFAAQ